ncbi:MAG: tetratricopeptide repeat protein [Vicinamibacteria bacterium]
MKRLVLAGGLFGALFFAVSDARAQTGTARGRVVDEQGQPVADAKVELDFQGGVNRKLETKTNKKGEYTQVGLHPGVYRITGSKEGYQPSYVEEKINLGEPTAVPDVKLMTAKAAQAAAAGKGGGMAELSSKYSAAAELLNAGKFDEAQVAFSDIVAKNPQLPEAHRGLGLIAMQKKDWATSQAELEKALELRPAYGDAWNSLATMYQASGQKEKAIATIKEAAAKNEGDATLQFNLGIFLLNAQDADGAEAAFKKAQTLDAANSEVEYYLGTIAIQKGNTAECIAHLEKYLASSPKNAQNAATAKGLIAALQPKK